MPIAMKTGARWRGLAAAVAYAMALVAFSAGLESPATFVSLRPRENSFWTTATNSTMSLPLDFPRSATSASLRICGVSYTNEIHGIVPLPSFSGGYVVSLPPAAKPKEENVYDRSIQDYATGVDALNESNRIKQEIIDFEQNVWEY